MTRLRFSARSVNTSSNSNNPNNNGYYTSEYSETSGNEDMNYSSSLMDSDERSAFSRYKSKLSAKLHSTDMESIASYDKNYDADDNDDDDVFENENDTIIRTIVLDGHAPWGFTLNSDAGSRKSSTTSDYSNINKSPFTVKSVRLVEFFFYIKYIFLIVCFVFQS